MNTTIKVKYADEPKDGKKLATIKTPEGKVFGLWPDKLNQFTIGNSYEVEYSERQHNGKTYTKIEKVIRALDGNGSNGSNGHSSNGNGDGGGNRDEVGARIERQHSQGVAVQYATLLGIDVSDKDAVLKPIIDWFQADVENAMKVAALAAEASALADGAEGNGSGDEGGF